MTNDVDKLIEENMNIANKLAWKYYYKFNKKIEFEELQSTSFLGLTKAAKSYNSDKSIAFSTYAYKCINNEILLYYYYNKKYISTYSLDFELRDDFTLSSIISDSSNNDAYNNLEIMQLRIYIEQLPEFEKKVINYYLAGYTMEQISSLLNCSIDHVYVTFRKLINRLRDKYSNYGKEEL